MKLLYNKSDKIVTVAKDIENDLIVSYRIIKEKVVTINNGFEAHSNINIDKSDEERKKV